MNGRIYDPLLGRFLSGDLVVQDPEDLQSYNRFSYTLNNPLSLVDPSGFVVWQPNETTLTEEQKKKMTAEQIAKVEAGNAQVRAYTKLVADAKAQPGGAALFKYLDGRNETFMYGNAASFAANTAKVGELTVSQIDGNKVSNGPVEISSWTVPTFKGFENSRYQQHDSQIMRVAVDFHFDPGKYSGGGNNLPSDLSPALMKAWLLQESGGSDARSLAAWPIDPGQVNVPGSDWGPYKSAVGLTQPTRRNTGTADGNITAAAMWLTRKGYGKSAQPLRNNRTGTFDGWQTALRRYNGRTDVTSNGQAYSVNYAQLIVDRAQNPSVETPLKLP